MNKNIEERVCLMLCVINGISCSDSQAMLRKCCGKVGLFKTRIYEFYKAFKDGRESVEDKLRSGRPSTSSTENNINQVKEIILHNRFNSLRDIARELHIFHESGRNILDDILVVRRVIARIAPKELNFLKKQYREQISLEMLDHTKKTFMVLFIFLS